MAYVRSYPLKFDIRGRAEPARCRCDLYDGPNSVNGQPNQIVVCTQAPDPTSNMDEPLGLGQYGDEYAAEVARVLGPAERRDLFFWQRSNTDGVSDSGTITRYVPDLASLAGKLSIAQLQEEVGHGVALHAP